MSDALVKQLMTHEGVRLKPYTDTVGKLTIGVGRNLADVGISSEEAMLLLTNDILRTSARVMQALPWVPGLDEVRRRVLFDMAFNMGIGGLLGFKKMLAAVQAGQWLGASEEMIASKWAGQVGQRAVTLAAMMRTGLDPFA
jgi:lysozyme